MLTLRDYQTRMVRDVLFKLRTHQRVLCEAPTGAGKRIVAVHLAQIAVEHNRRMVFVTDRRQLLVPQMSEECQKHGVPFGVVMGDFPRNDDAPIQLCSIQTLKRRKYQDLPPADLVVVDEAHKESLAYDELFRHYSDAKIVGFTATPVGAGGTKLVV